MNNFMRWLALPLIAFAFGGHAQTVLFNEDFQSCINTAPPCQTVNCNSWVASHGSPSINVNLDPNLYVNMFYFMGPSPDQAEGLYRDFTFQAGVTYTISFRYIVRDPDTWLNVSLHDNLVPGPAPGSLGTDCGSTMPTAAGELPLESYPYPGPGDIWQDAQVTVTPATQMDHLWFYPTHTGTNPNKVWVRIDDITITEDCYDGPFITGLRPDPNTIPSENAWAEVANSVKPLPSPQCGYVMAGFEDRLGFENTWMLVVRSNNDGTVNWAREYSGPGFNGHGELNDIEVIEDGFVVTGWTEGVQFGSGNRDMIVMRLDWFGTPVWSRVIPYYAFEEGMDVEQTSDGGFVVTGTMNDEAAVWRLDAAGFIQWNSTLGNINQRWEGISIEQTDDDGDGQADDGFVVCGTRLFLDPNIPPFPYVGPNGWVVMKFDAAGGHTWTEDLTGSNYDDEPFSIKQMDVDGDGILDEHYAVGGYLDLTDLGMLRQQAYLVHVTHQPVPFYNGVVYDDGANGSRITGLEQTADNGLILTGWVNETGSSTLRDAFLIKTDVLGNATWSESYGLSNSDDWSLSVEELPGLGYTCAGASQSFFGTPDIDILHVQSDLTGAAGICMPQNDMVSWNLQMQRNEAFPQWNSYQLTEGPPVFGSTMIYENENCLGLFQGKTDDSEAPSIDAAYALQVFPNPAGAGQAIEVRQTMPTASGQVRIILTDLSGRNVYNEQVGFSDGQLRTALPSGHLSKGVYHLSVRSNDGSQTLLVMIE